MGARERAAESAWGGSMPDWVRAMAQAVDGGTSQAALARTIGYSPATVSQVLAAAYRGNMDHVERRVRGALMRERVVCPVLGDLDGRACLEHQKRPFSAASGMAVRLWRACQDCGHNLQGARQ